MILLNFAHPLTPAQRAQVEALTNQPISRLIERPAQFDPAQPFAPQVVALLDTAGLSPAEWQSAPLLLNPPSLNVIAAVLLAELHGRCGYFPPVIRLRRLADSLPPQFEVAEVVNLQAIRETARGSRGAGERGGRGAGEQG